MDLGFSGDLKCFALLPSHPNTFQEMINKILRDLINTGEVVSFIDNIIVGTKEEEGHDEIVEKVVKRLEKDDLYVKPEKCK